MLGSLHGVFQVSPDRCQGISLESSMLQYFLHPLDFSKTRICKLNGFRLLLLLPCFLGNWLFHDLFRWQVRNNWQVNLPDCIVQCSQLKSRFHLMPCLNFYQIKKHSCFFTGQPFFALCLFPLLVGQACCRFDLI